MSDQSNTWPGGKRHAMNQQSHSDWNAANYPGTRQLCSLCDEPTGRCEDDSMYVNDESVCEGCYLLSAKELVNLIDAALEQDDG